MPVRVNIEQQETPCGILSFLIHQAEHKIHPTQAFGEEACKNRVKTCDNTLYELDLRMTVAECLIITSPATAIWTRLTLSFHLVNARHTPETETNHRLDFEIITGPAYAGTC